jgi:hypothetical protein
MWLEKNASENNHKSIEESTKYFNSKVKAVEFKEEDWVLMKENNFLNKNKKLDETFKGPFENWTRNRMIKYHSKTRHKYVWKKNGFSIWMSRFPKVTVKTMKFGNGCRSLNHSLIIRPV